eukprot:9167353-Karenia_brevis.AAC.1
MPRLQNLGDPPGQQTLVSATRHRSRGGATKCLTLGLGGTGCDGLKGVLYCARCGAWLHKEVGPKC